MSDTAAQVQVIAGVLGAPIETADLALQAAARGTRAEVAASLILAALAAAGFELVRLPEGKERTDHYGQPVHDLLGWSRCTLVVKDADRFGPANIIYTTPGTGHSFTPADARTFAAALLAAACHAEAAQ